MNKKRIILKYLGIALLLAVLFLVFIFIPENPYLSNYLKRLILPEIQTATGYTVTAQKIYLHIFPFYAGIKGLRFIDKGGEVVAGLESLKVYPEISSVLSKRIIIKRVSARGLFVDIDKERLELLKENLKDYMEQGKAGPELIVKGLDISKGNLRWSDEGFEADLGGLSLSYRLREDGEVNASIERLSLSSLGAAFSVRSYFKFRPDSFKKEITLKALDLYTGNSDIRLSGRLMPEGLSEFSTTINLSMGDMVSLFSLKSYPEDRGRIRAKGLVRLHPEAWNDESVGFTQKIELDLGVKTELRLENLMEFFRVSDITSGLLRADLHLKGNFLEPEIEGRAYLTDGVLFGVEVDDLVTKVSYRDNRFVFPHAEARLYGGRAIAMADIPLPAENFSLYIKAEDISDKAILRLLQVDIPVPDGVIKGELSHSGRVFSPVGWFFYKAGPPEQFERKSNNDGIGYLSLLNPLKTLHKMEGFYLYDGEKGVLLFDKLSISSRPFSLSLKGSYNVLQGEIDAHYCLHLNPDILKGEFFDFKRGEIKGDIRGVLSQALIKGDIEINSLSFNRKPFETLKGRFTYQPSELRIPSIMLSERPEGQKGSQLMVSGDIRFRGAQHPFDFTSPRFAIGVKFKDLSPFQFFDLKDLSGLGPLYDGEITFSGDKELQELVIMAKGAGSSIEGRLNLRRWMEYAYQVSSQMEIKELGLPLSEHIKATTNLRLTGSGRFPELNGLVELSSDMLIINNRPFGPFKIRSLITKESQKEPLMIAATGSFLDGLIILKGKSNLKELSYNFELEFKDGDYKALLQALLNESPEDTGLSLKGLVRMNGKGLLLSGEAFFEKFVLTRYGHELKNSGPVLLTFDDNIMALKALHLSNEAGSITGSGRVLIGQWYELELKGSSYLGPLKRFSRSIRTIKGRADFEVFLTGRWESPMLSGTISLKDGTIGIEDIPYHVTQAESLIRLKDNKVEIEYLTGKVAGGSVRAKGVAYLRKFRLGRFNIEVELNDINAKISEDFNTTFNADLYLKGERYLNLITGELSLRKAFYRRFIEWRSWMIRLEKERPQPDIAIPTWLDARLNIRIRGPLPEADSVLLIDNNIAEARLKVDLLLRGTVKRPVLFGRVETLSGVVYFRNNELELINASADFTDPEKIDPYFRVRAETLSRGYRITLLVEGTLRRFNLSLSSEPPLDEVDIISLLAVGEIGTALKGYGGGIGAAEATSFITGELQETLEQRARHLTGVDRVQISPYVSKIGEIGPRVTVGKKLGERLSLLYSSAVGSQESDVIKIEYELSNKVFLVGERDERGSMGGDIRFRFHFR